MNYIKNFTILIGIFKSLPESSNRKRKAQRPEANLHHWITVPRTNVLATKLFPNLQSCTDRDCLRIRGLHLSASATHSEDSVCIRTTLIGAALRLKYSDSGTAGTGPVSFFSIEQLNSG